MAKINTLFSRIKKNLLTNNLLNKQKLKTHLPLLGKQNPLSTYLVYFIVANL